MRTPLLISFLLLAGAFNTAQSQIQPQLPPFYLGPVDSVVIWGNKHTRDYVIRNEMSIVAHSQFTPDMLEFDRKRIYSLGLFTNVDLYLDTLAGKSVLRVLVEERWYIFPVPLVGFRDGDVKRAYYGAGLYHNNFQGKNQKLFGSVVFGADPIAQLSFSDPLVIHEERISFGAQLSFSRKRNRSEIEAAATGDFDERHYGGSFSIGKRFDLYNAAGISIGYNVVEISSYRPHRTVAANGIDRYLFTNLYYAYDSRDLAEYPTQGGYIGAYVTKYGLWTSDVDFSRYGLDVRKYVGLPFSFTLAARLAGGFAAGNEVPTYAHAFLGYGDRVRGYFTTVLEGDHVVISTVELRYPLLPPRVFRVNNPLLPDEFSVWRFGIGFALFADAGTVWYRGQSVSLSSFVSGYGGGLDFMFPYGLIMRVDYAWNNLGKGQFILDFRRAI